MCVCVRPSRAGLSQASYSPDEYNFKDEDLNVGVSIEERGFNPCVHGSEGCVVLIHKMRVCMHEHSHLRLSS